MATLIFRIPDGHMCAHANQARIRFVFEEAKKCKGGKPSFECGLLF